MFHVRAARAAVALTALAVISAGCSSGDESPSAQKSGPPTGGGGNTQEVCAATKTLMNDGMSKIGQAIAAGAKATATGDKEGEAKSKADTAAAFTDLATQLRGQAGKATEAELKKTLEAVATGVEAASKTPDSIGNNPELNTAGEALGKACS